jgi:hypothetical protein
LRDLSGGFCRVMIVKSEIPLAPKMTKERGCRALERMS